MLHFNAKINEVKGEIPSIATTAATTSAITTAENKIPNVSDLVKKKKNYDTEIKYIKDKYFTTFDYNNFTNNILDEKITTKKLVNESVLNEKIKPLIANKEIKKKKKNATKAELEAEQDEIVKIQTYGLSIFIYQS